MINEYRFEVLVNENVSPRDGGWVFAFYKTDDERLARIMYDQAVKVYPFRRVKLYDSVENKFQYENQPANAWVITNDLIKELIRRLGDK